MRPGCQENTRVVSVSDAKDRASALLECRAVERWPYSRQLDVIRGPNGRKYRFDIWVDEEGLMAGREDNLCASLAAHPLNEAFGHVIAGPALLVPLPGGRAFSLEDWGQICKGVWSLECDCEDDCEQGPGLCPRVRLVEANLQGPLAAKVRM